MDYAKIFLSGARDCTEYAEAIDIVRQNSTGKIWLTGGFVFRTLANQLYSIPAPKVDLDFIVETPVAQFNLPIGWREEQNSFGNPKFVKGKSQIDYVPLSNIHSILHRKVQPTIENYLSGVPLTIQSIAYDVKDGKIMGTKGIDALQQRIVEVNNLELAMFAAQKKNKSLREYIHEKAESLGFTPVFPERKSRP